MRDYNHRNRQKTRTGATGPAVKPGLPVHTAEQRDTVRHGLRILARIIARAHLRQEASQAAQEPPPKASVANT